MARNICDKCYGYAVELLKISQICDKITGNMKDLSQICQIKELPIYPYLKEICDTLKKSPCRFLILTAETGAGKSTALPLALLNSFEKKILMLEPRRIAATAVANREAELLGEEVGQSVGYRIYLENKVSDSTRLEVMTEAILTRRIQNDPELSDTSVVVLDEFHERSINGDLALAFLKEAMEVREDLFVVVMSATIDAKRLSEFCGKENAPAPVMQIPGRTFPVEYIYKKEMSAAQAIKFAVKNISYDGSGKSLLVFLPGIYEIKKNHSELESVAEDVFRNECGWPGKIEILNLHSSITFEEQKKILEAAAPGTVRIILSSSIAETSVTIPDVVCVIDSGLSRYSEMNNNVGASRLVTLPESEFSAAQRAGRAGRTQRGICIRLWSEKEPRQKTSVPEILRSDLAEVVLDCAEWGCLKASSLDWLDKPADGAWLGAQELLRELKCIDSENRITELGRAVLKVGLGPRLSCVAIFGSAKDVNPFSQYKDSPLWLQKKFSANIDGRTASIQKGTLLTETERCPLTKEPLLAGFPDRLAVRSGDDGTYQFYSGRLACLKDFKGGLCPKYILAPETDAGITKGKIYSYKVLDEDFAEAWLKTRATRETVCDFEDGKVKKTELVRYGKIILSKKILKAGPDDFKAALCTFVRKNGIDSLPTDDRIKGFLIKLKFYEQNSTEKNERKFDPEYLRDNAEEWLLPFVTQNKIACDNIYDALYYFYDGARVEQKVPSRLTLETGRSVKVIYVDGERVQPVIEVIIQQVFGCLKSPRIMETPVLLRLLSPARRPLQITSDLENFWVSTWPEICKEMKGRYPKHNWDYRISQRDE